MSCRPLPADGSDLHATALAPVRIELVPMEGDLVGATDLTAGCVYVREDATRREIGAAILTGAREVTDAHHPPDDRDVAPVIPLIPRAETVEEDRRGLG